MFSSLNTNLKPASLAVGWAGATLLLSALFAPAVAGVYRWVDANGAVHYTDQPRAGQHQKYEPGRSNVVKTDLKDAGSYFERQAAAREQAQQEKQQARASSQEKARHCEQARQRAKFLSENPAHRLKVKSESGQVQPVTQEQWEAQREVAQQRISEFCA